MTATRQTRIMIFNPYLMPLDSLSLIELPVEYQIFDFGPLYKLTKSSRHKSLCILAAKAKRIDEEYFSKESELYIFIVNDMTPTLTFRPFKSTDLLFKNNS